MSQVIHTVTQTEKEFHEYQKKKAREAFFNLLLGLMVFTVGMGSICALVGYFR